MAHPINGKAKTPPDSGPTVRQHSRRAPRTLGSDTRGWSELRDAASGRPLVGFRHSDRVNLFVQREPGSCGGTMRLPCRAGWPRLGCDATDACRAAGCCGSRCARSAAARRCRPACRPARCAPSSRAAAQCRPTRRTPGTSSGSTRARFKGFAASPRICTPKAIPPRCSTCPGWSDTADTLWFAAVSNRSRVPSFRSAFPSEVSSLARRTRLLWDERRTGPCPAADFGGVHFAPPGLMSTDQPAQLEQRDQEVVERPC